MALAAYAVRRDPDDEDHRLLATIKSNLAPKRRPWGYTLVAVPDLGVARVDWDDSRDPRSAGELSAGTQTAAMAEAAARLTEWRQDHSGELPAAPLLGDAAHADIATSTGTEPARSSDSAPGTPEGWIITD